MNFMTSGSFKTEKHGKFLPKLRRWYFQQTQNRSQIGGNQGAKSERSALKHKYEVYATI